MHARTHCKWLHKLQFVAEKEFPGQLYVLKRQRQQQRRRHKWYVFINAQAEGSNSCRHRREQMLIDTAITSQRINIDG